MASSNKEINPLHSAATVTTLFTLSGVRESELRDHSFLKNAPHDIIARSGGIGNARITSPRETQTFTGPAGLRNFTDFTGQHQHLEEKPRHVHRERQHTLNGGTKRRT